MITRVAVWTLNGTRALQWNSWLSCKRASNKATVQRNHEPTLNCCPNKSSPNAKTSGKGPDSPFSVNPPCSPLLLPIPPGPANDGAEVVALAGTEMAKIRDEVGDVVVIWIEGAGVLANHDAASFRTLSILTVGHWLFGCSPANPLDQFEPSPGCAGGPPKHMMGADT